MRTLVILSAVLAAAMARPSALEAAQSTPADAALPMEEANAGDIKPAQTGSSRQNPLADPLQTSKPVNPSFHFVDNPHIGLPFGTVIPLPEPINRPQLLSSVSPYTIRIDSPHVGLPPSGSAYDSPASTTIVSRPISAAPTSPSSNTATGNSLYKLLTDVPSTVFIPTSFPTASPNVLIPISKSISQVPNSVSLPVKIDPASFLLTNPYGGFLAKTPSPNFLSKTSSAAFTPGCSHGKFLFNVPVNSATSGPTRKSPQNLLPHGFPTTNPITNPLTNIAFTINNPPPSIPVNIPSTTIPTSNPSSNLLANSANVLLFSENVPFENVINTAQGPILVGGPSNFAIFPQQPSLDDINQVLAAHLTAVAPATPAAMQPANTHITSPSPDTIFFAGVPISLSGSH